VATRYPYNRTGRRPEPPVPPVDRRPEPESGPRGGDPPPLPPRGPRDTGQRPGEAGPPDPNPVPAPEPGPGNTFPRPIEPGYNSLPFGEDTGYLPEPGAFDPTMSAEPPAPAPPPTYPRYTPISQTGGPSITSENPDRQAQQDRIGAQHAGNALDQDLVNFGNTQGARAGGYENQLNEQYAPFLNGGGGYTPDEQNAILGQDRLNNLQLTPEQQAENYLTPDEQSAMLGNPEAGQEYFQPDRERSTASRGSNAQRGAVQQMSGELDAATDYGRMSVRQGYGDDLVRTAEGTGENVRDVLGNEDMEVSDQFLSDYQMSDAEKQGIVTSGGMDVRDRFQSQIDDMGRRARAEGTNAVGAAAMQDRLQRHGASEAGDVMTRARVAAEAEQARRQQQGEDMRVGYGQRAGSIRSGAELNLGRMTNDAISEAERTRLSAEQNYAGQRSRNVATAGDARLNTERNVAATELGAEQRFTDQGIGLQQHADQQRVARAGNVADNRQATTRYNQGAQFQRGTYADTATTQRTAVNAGARRQDQQEARGHLAGQQQQANQNVNNATQGRLQNNATTQGARANATGNLTQAQGTPGRGERLLNGFISGAQQGAAAAFGGAEKGGVFTKPTYVLIGEAGPEAVVPLGYGDDDTEVLPSVAMQSGSFDTAPPPMRGQSAYATRYQRRAM
jgi:hypothetical protein